MTELIIKAAVLLAFALALLALNLKARHEWLKELTFWVMLASFVGAGYYVALVVLT
jgi:hypothetical protein